MCGGGLFCPLLELKRDRPLSPDGELRLFRCSLMCGATVSLSLGGEEGQFCCYTGGKEGQQRLFSCHLVESEILLPLGG